MGSVYLLSPYIYIYIYIYGDREICFKSKIFENVFLLVLVSSSSIYMLFPLLFDPNFRAKIGSV